jgi:hypothetical protein
VEQGAGAVIENAGNALQDTVDPFEASENDKREKKGAKK